VLGWRREGGSASFCDDSFLPRKREKERDVLLPFFFSLFPFFFERLGEKGAELLKTRAYADDLCTKFLRGVVRPMLHFAQRGRVIKGLAPCG
jgi:hypothetical protein